MDLISSLWDIVVHLDRHLGDLVHMYGTYVYGIIFLIIFCETGLVVTPFLPGDSLLFVAGAVWAASDMSPHPLALTVLIAAFCGDNVNYLVGRLIGKRLFNRTDSKLFNHKLLERTESFYARHGGKTVIMARFVPLVRTFAPFVAGLGHMTFTRYIGFSVIASLLWVGLLVYSGYYFGNVPLVKQNLSVVIVAVVAISVAPMLLELLRNKLRGPQSTGVPGSKLPDSHLPKG